VKAHAIPIVQVNGISIAQANWRDVRSFHQLEKKCFPMDAWPIWDVVAALTLPNIVRLKAVEGDHFVGFILGERRPIQKLAWVATFAVDPNYRRQGIGSTLLQRCEELLDCPRIRLSVRVTNESAIRLYKSFGYKIISTWPHYYRGDEDAFVMEKSAGK